MTNYNSFHCKIDITRNLPNNITTKDTLHNFLNFFFNNTPTPFISIGGSKKSSVVVKGLNKKHCMFNFQHDSMVIKTYGNIKIKSNGKEESFEKNDICILKFEENKIIESHMLMQAIIEIHPYVMMRITVTREEGLEKQSIEDYLIKKYGLAQKISESERYLIYKVSDEFVVKILHPYYNQEQLQVVDFFRLAKNLMFLETDVIANIEDFDEDLPHVKMNRVVGQTLQNYLAKKGKLSYNEAILVLKKLLDLLNKTEESNYICKNLNLDNILCGRDKKIIFTGWNTTLDGILLNSIHALYLAPEYIRGERATTTADIYSMGIIFYRLITGCFPFHNTKNYQQRVIDDKPISSLELQKGSVYITSQVSLILEQMLAFHPEDRPSIVSIETWLKNVNDLKLWESVLNEHDLFYALQIVSSPKEIHGQIYLLEDNKTYIIGRQADINIPDKHMSRKHTKLILENGICVLEDLGSINGTQIMDEKISKCQIDSEVTFKIGQTILAFWNYQQLREERKNL